MRMIQASVIGPSEVSTEISEIAEKVGAMLSKRGVVVITGGKGGVMEAASRGASAVGGITIGIVPSADVGEANRWCSVVIPTGLDHARNVLVALAGDFLIALGISPGTLSEICFAWLHERPVLALTGENCWPETISQIQFNDRRPCRLITCENVEALETAIHEICEDVRGILAK
jgi:uncharacterized protein (TIGR00725 family)